MPPENAGTSGSLAGRAGDGSVARGQSRTIALLLLTVVTIGLTVALAAFSFALTPSESDEVAMTSVDVEVTEDRVTVVHSGGDSFPAEELRLEVNGGEQSIRLDTFTTTPGNDKWFAAGERWEHDVEFTDDRVYVAVVHEPTGTVLVEHRERF